MTRAHLISRVVTTATQPVVRTVGPWLSEAVKHFLQFLGFLVLGCLILLIAAISGANGIPWHVIHSAALVIGLIPAGFATLVVIAQIRLTYAKQDIAVYKPVEPFEQRRPPQIPDETTDADG